jgi:hypothetical protein
MTSSTKLSEILGMIVLCTSEFQKWLLAWIEKAKAFSLNQAQSTQAKTPDQIILPSRICESDGPISTTSNVYSSLVSTIETMETNPAELLGLVTVLGTSCGEDMKI